MYDFLDHLDVLIDNFMRNNKGFQIERIFLPESKVPKSMKGDCSIAKVITRNGCFDVIVTQQNHVQFLIRLPEVSSPDKGR
jgi:hypothetical protein